VGMIRRALCHRLTRPPPKFRFYGEPFARRGRGEGGRGKKGKERKKKKGGLYHVRFRLGPYGPFALLKAKFLRYLTILGDLRGGRKGGRGEGKGEKKRVKKLDAAFWRRRGSLFRPCSPISPYSRLLPLLPPPVPVLK